MTQRTDIDGLFALLLARPQSTRTLVGIAGAPGSGKSTFARQLLTRLNAAAPGRAALLEMDGFHYDDGLLRQMGRLAHKGAPDTFDADGLRHILQRLRLNAGDGVCAPVFDRDLEIARAGANLIPRSVPIVLVEGNYLLLDTAPWAGMAADFDITVMVEADRATLRARLTARWQGYGLDAAEVARKVEENDLPNAMTVQLDSVAADFSVTS